LQHNRPLKAPPHELSQHLEHRASTTLQEIVSLPPYALTTFLHHESRLADGGNVPLILDALASQSPTRAALALADLSGVVLNKYLSEDHNPEGKMLASVIDRCSSLKLIHEAMISLPTLDAIKCRYLILRIRDSRFIDATAAAMYSTLRPHPRYAPPEQIHDALHYLRDSGKWLKSSSTIHERYYTMARERCKPLTINPELSPRNDTILSEFRDQIAPKLFPTQNYGYGSLSDILECMPVSKDLWGVKNPWGNSPDAPSPLCHQCADSAPAARSFFVSRGIPADVYIMRIGGVYHNVCIAFFEENGQNEPKLVPTLVDVSPFGGFYELSATPQGSAPSLLNPINSGAVFGQRANPLPFIEASGFSSMNSGLLPWCCEDLPSGRARVIGFGGVVANQKYGGWLPERGTPEYYGMGIRTPRPELSVHVMPRKGDSLASLSNTPFISLSYHEVSGEAVSYGYIPEEQIQNESLAQLRAGLLHELQPIATRQLQKIKAMVERSGYSLEERAFQ
jgi:hypothetical protein